MSDREQPQPVNHEMEGLLNLVSAIDRNYVIPYSIMIKSFRDSNPDLRTACYVIHYDLTKDDINYLTKVAVSIDISLSFISIPKYPYVLFKTRRRTSLSNRSTMSPIAYAKAFVDRFLPSNINRAILIDADIVIIGSMRELLDMPLTRPVAAVQNIPRSHHHQFNSGMVVIDLAKWRNLKISDTAENFLLAYSDTLHSHDQQTLNLIFAGNWQPLGLKWNYIEDHFRFMQKNTAFSEQEILQARGEPVVIHYAVGSDKPWLKDSRHPRVDLYRRYDEMLKKFRAGIDVVQPH